MQNNSRGGKEKYWLWIGKFGVLKPHLFIIYKD